MGIHTRLAQFSRGVPAIRKDFNQIPDPQPLKIFPARHPSAVHSLMVHYPDGRLSFGILFCHEQFVILQPLAFRPC